MYFKNFNLILMLIAGIIVGIVSVLMSYSVQRLMFTLVVVLGVFYLIGTFVQTVSNRIFESTDQEMMEQEIAKLEEEKKELEQVTDNVDETEEENPG